MPKTAKAKEAQRPIEVKASNLKDTTPIGTSHRVRQNGAIG